LVSCNTQNQFSASLSTLLTSTIQTINQKTKVIGDALDVDMLFLHKVDNTAFAAIFSLACLIQIVSEFGKHIQKEVNDIESNEKLGNY